VPTNKQRREAARRHLERQLQRRAEREAARKRFTMIASIVGTIIVIAVVVVFIVAVGGDDKTPSPQAEGSNPAGYGTSAPSSPTPAETGGSKTAAKGECTFTPDGQAAKSATPPPNGKVPTSGTVTVDVTTSQGPLTVQLDRAKAPCTVDSFVSLVKQHYYDKTPCHRLVTDGIYVLQCGDPTGTGTGGPGYTIPDEATGTEQYPAGTVAMARTQAPNSGGSQFFIVYKDSPNLMQKLGAQQYTVFGKLTDGLPVIDKIAAAGTTSGGSDGAPKLSTEITSMTVAS
jgi:peptidyl-prolyl cis-trans isomerase B (cyclophilin B)